MYYLHKLKPKGNPVVVSLGSLMATTIQYCNIYALHRGQVSELKAIKAVKGDEENTYDVLSYTQQAFDDIQEHVDLDDHIDDLFEGFMQEASVVPCAESELKTFFQLMYRALAHKAK